MNTSARRGKEPAFGSSGWDKVAVDLRRKCGNVRGKVAAPLVKAVGVSVVAAEFSSCLYVGFSSFDSGRVN